MDDVAIRSVASVVLQTLLRRPDPFVASAERMLLPLGRKYTRTCKLASNRGRRCRCTKKTIQNKSISTFQPEGNKAEFIIIIIKMKRLCSLSSYFAQIARKDSASFVKRDRSRRLGGKPGFQLRIVFHRHV